VRLSNIIMPTLAAGSPRLEYDKPIVEDGKWLVSGKMIVEGAYPVDSGSSICSGCAGLMG
jgi:hypothetical protein